MRRHTKARRMRMKRSERFMKKLALVLAVCVAMCTLFGMGALADEKIRVAVVYADTVDDQGWCQAMHSGIVAANETLGGTIEYTPVERVATADAAATLRQLADQGYEIIICHGAQFASAVTDVAEEYEEIAFAYGTSGDVLEGSNIFTYMPQSEETGFLNGVVAGLTTKTNKVGMVGPADGGDAYRYVRGFKMGVQAVNADAEVSIAFTGSFSDTVGAGQLAASFIEAGADVIAGASQQALGALRTVAEYADKDVWWVAQEAAQLEGESGYKTIAAAGYDYSAVIFGLLDYVKDGVLGGQNIPMNYANGGFIYTFSETNAMATDAVKAAVQEKMDTMKATPNSELVAAYADVSVE